MLPKIFSNKKSDIAGRKLIFYIVFGFALTGGFLLLMWLLPKNASEVNEIPIGLENYLSAQRFLNSPLCFAFQDKDTSIVYPGMIDLTKFNQDNLNKCYNAENTKVKAYRFTLNYNNRKSTISTKNWEGLLKEAKTEQVLVNDIGNIQGAELFIEVQDAK